MVSIATQRTKLSPRCFWTSRISAGRVLARHFDRLVQISGSSASGELDIHHAAQNLNHTAGCLRHSRLLLGEICTLACGERLRAAGDVEQVAGDRLLAGLVVLQLQCPTSSLALSVALRIATMRAACSLASDFEDRLVDLQGGKARDDLVQDLALGRFVDVGRSQALVGIVLHPPACLAHLEREQLLDHGLLAHHVDEIGVDQVDFVRLALQELVHRQPPDGRYVGEGGRGRQAAELGDDLLAAAQEHVASLAADGDVAHRHLGIDRSAEP